VINGDGIRYDTTNYVVLKYGLTSITDNFSLKQHSFAVDIIGDEISNNIKPKLDVTYISIDDSDSVDYLLQGAINGYGEVNYLNYQGIFPYYYGGFGYEYVSGSRKDFDNSFYLQLGWGAEIPISDLHGDPRVVAEFRFMQLLGSDNGQDNEATFFIGVKIPLDGVNSYDDNTPQFSQASSYAEFGDQVSPPVQPSINAKFSSKRSRNLDVISDEDGDGVRDELDICSNTPRNRAVNDRGCPIRDDRTYPESSSNGSFDSLALPNNRKVLDVHFKLNSDQIAMESREIVRKFVKAVNMTGYSNIIVEGYTDSTGRYDANKDLSQRRANSVRNLMVQYGVDTRKIEALGKGSVNPIATNETEDGRAQNRRIEIVVK
jgi:outer membrane protein OmpA-like peptidoglycan-associated protein